MTPVMLAQRLRLARTAHDTDLAAFSRLIGIRVDHVRAIEDGRFSDLPAGIYGRAAVKAYAAACGLDAAAVLADAEAWLVSMDDPIIGIARLKGLRVPAAQPPPEAAPPPIAPRPADVDAALATWRPLAASLIDAAIISVLLGIVVLSAVAALFVPVSTLRGSSPAFALMGMLLAAGYFVWFGGVGGATVGERVMRINRPQPRHDHLTLPAIATRALHSATEDIDCLRSLGARLGRWLAPLVPATYGSDGVSSR